MVDMKVFENEVGIVLRGLKKVEVGGLKSNRRATGTALYKRHAELKSIKNQ